MVRYDTKSVKVVNLIMKNTQYMIVTESLLLCLLYHSSFL